MSYRFAPLILSLSLVSCGGGGDDPAPLALDGGQISDYAATSGFRDGRTIAFSVFEGGLILAFYQSNFAQVPFPAYAYAGFFIGTTTGSGSSRTYQGTDFDFDAATAFPSSLTLYFVPGNTTASGQLVHAGSADRQGDPVYGTYSSVSTEPTGATIGGNYVGYARSVVASVPGLTGTVDAHGSLSMTGGGCSITGMLMARPTGNFHDASVSLSGTCPVAAGDYRGHAFQSYLTGNIYLMTTDFAGQQGLFIHLYAPS